MKLRTSSAFRFLMVSVLAAGLAAGCATVMDQSPAEKRAASSPLEFRHQKVGLFVQEEVEDFYFPGTTTLDMSDLMAFHLQRVLPFNLQERLLEIFEQVEIKPPGPKIEFKTPDLAGYFEVKTARVRYDYPDPDVSQYRADVNLMVEFKDMQQETVWKQYFAGDGLSFANTDRDLTRFGREPGTALEEAFEDAASKIQKEVSESQGLRDYFRLRPSSGAASPPQGQSGGSGP